MLPTLSITTKFTCYSLHVDESNLSFSSTCFAVVETGLLHLAAVILNNGGAPYSLHVLHKQAMHG